MAAPARLGDVPAPFVAPPPARYRDRVAAVCKDCFSGRKVCRCFPEKRLFCLLVGHNPSDHAWASGYMYSNPTNNFLRLLTGTLGKSRWPGLLPHHATLKRQNSMPLADGVGLIDVNTDVRGRAARPPRCPR